VKRKKSETNWRIKGFMILSIMAVFLLAACGQSPATPEQSAAQGGQDNGEGKVTVYTTIYPLQYAADRIGGNHVEVINVVPPGVEPHDFEPTAQDLVAMAKADLFVYNGSGFETWVEQALDGFDQSSMVVIEATEGLELLAAEDAHAEEGHEGVAHEGESGAESDHAHEHGDLDPHVWLDPTLLKAMAENVKAGLIKADPAHSETYEQNFAALAADLDALDRDFQSMASQAAKKEFMVSHSAFGYLAHRYGLEQIAISGINPGDEPSPAELKELVEHVKEHGITTILFETLVSPKVAEVIARETGAKTAMLNPLEGLTEEEAQAGKDYLDIMQENLETLRSALQ